MALTVVNSCKFVTKFVLNIVIILILISNSFTNVVLLRQPGLSRPEQAGAPDLQNLIKEIQTSIDKSLADARKNLNLPNDPNGEAIIKAIKEQTQKAEVALKDMTAKVEQQVSINSLTQ